MNRINGVRRSEFNHNKSQHNPLTEEQKIHNILEANSTFLQILREELEKHGGMTNVQN